MTHTPQAAVSPLAEGARWVFPGLAPTTVVVVARWWHAQGAGHSASGGLLLTGLATMAVLIGVCCAGRPHGTPVLTGSAFATAGVLALGAIAGYSSGLALPVLLALVMAGLGYTLAYLRWSDERRRALDHQRALQLRQVELEAARLATYHRLAVGPAEPWAQAVPVVIPQLSASARRRLTAAPADFPSAALPTMTDHRESKESAC